MNYLKQFHEIVISTYNGQWRQAGRQASQANFDAAELIRINEDVKDCYLVFENKEGTHTEVVPFRKLTDIALVMDQKHKFELTLKSE
jgi:hypothetical protein